MARKKAPPKRAPEYEKPKAKKKSPPGKAKDGSKCFTRTNKGGAAYVTCEGSQKKAKAKASLKSGGPPPVMTKKKPKSTIGGYSGQKVKVGTLNKGSLNLTKPKPKAKAKPSVSKEDFMNVSSIIGTRNKQRVEENFDKLTTWNPLATAKLAPNTWSAVRIFPYSGGGKGKIYEAYYKKNFKNQHRKLKPNRGTLGSNMSMTWGQNDAHYHGADEAPRRQFRFSNGDVNTIEREGGEYKFPIDGSGNDSDLILAPLNIQKYYKYSEEKAIEGEDQEHDHPNDIVRKFKFKPAVKDINKLIFTYRYY